MTAMVTVVEVAALGKPAEVEREARALDLTVRDDWAGRPALTVDEARALVGGDARREVEHAQGWEAHQRECKAWREARDGAAREAAAKVRAAARRGAPPGMVSAQARQAAFDAAEHYERTVPRPRFNGTTAVPLEFVNPEELSA